MTELLQARSLIKFIEGLNITEWDDNERTGPLYDHLGAIILDTVLQPGLGYNQIVKPRVERMISTFPEARTIDAIKQLIGSHGVEHVMDWRHITKKERFVGLIQFLYQNEINELIELIDFLSYKVNRELILTIKGIGPKSLDYLLLLTGYDTIAVDRHIINFIEIAGIEHRGYFQTKRIVEFAANLMSIEKSTLDATLWRYMSEKQNLKNNQVLIDF